MTAAGVVVAAGLSKRMGAFKPLLPFRGKTVIEAAVGLLFEGGASEVYLVLGREAETIRELFDGNEAVTCLYNPDYADGDMWKSVRIGLAAAAGHDAVFFLPGDMPSVSAAICRELLSHMEESGCLWTRPVWRGKGQHPILMRQSAVKTVLGFEGDGGLKGALHTLPEPPTEIPVLDPGVELDIDRPEEYEYLLRYDAFKQEGITLIRTREEKP